MSPNALPVKTQHEQDDAEYIRRWRNFEIALGEIFTSLVIGLVAFATLLADGKSSLTSIVGGLAAFALAAFVIRRFFIH